MKRDDDVCLCFHVTLGKVQSFLTRENPPVASLISDCLGAGTGCGWCVPYLREMHAQHVVKQAVDLDLGSDEYAEARGAYRKTGQRDTESP